MSPVGIAPALNIFHTIYKLFIALVEYPGQDAHCCPVDDCRRLLSKYRYAKSFLASFKCSGSRKVPLNDLARERALKSFRIVMGLLHLIVLP